MGMIDMKLAARLFLLTAPFLIPACGGDGGGGSDDNGGTPGVTIVTFAPPGPGASGMSVGYSNGHPLDWITDDATTLANENDVLTQLNAHRAANSLGPLTMDANLRKCARGHSRHMHDDIHNFFDHPNPEGHGPGFRATQNGVTWSSLAENIAAGYATPTAVMTGWINSPGHNSNMLGPYTRVGIGYSNGPGGPYWTQVFAN